MTKAAGGEHVAQVGNGRVEQVLLAGREEPQPHPDGLSVEEEHADSPLAALASRAAHGLEHLGGGSEEPTDRYHEVDPAHADASVHNGRAHEDASARRLRGRRGDGESGGASCDAATAVVHTYHAGTPGWPSAPTWKDSKAATRAAGLLPLE